SWTQLDQNVYAFGKDAKEYFNLGLESSLAYKKIDYFTKALELDPRLADAYEKRGIHFYFQGKYDRVIEDYTEYIRLVPDKADAFRMLGMGYLKTGNYQKAIVSFDKAIHLAPKMSSAYTYRAEAFRLNGQIGEAIQDANMAITTGSDMRILADAYRTRAKAYRELGEEASASTDFKKAAEVDPRYFFYRYVSGYADLEDMRQAGLLGMIGLAFVFIFGFKFKAPQKEE
ncbi:MAG: tetratricopeptide repeat protein, partial [Desulfobacterales bacterium]